MSRNSRAIRQFERFMESVPKFTEIEEEGELIAVITHYPETGKVEVERVEND